MGNPFLDRINKKAKQSKAYWRSPKQEKSLSKRIGGRLVPASGAKFKKGDVWKPGVARIEAKTTSASSFRVTSEMVDKITNACIASDEVPVIVIEFLSNLGSPQHEVAVLPMWALERLISDVAASQETRDKA